MDPRVACWFAAEENINAAEQLDVEEPLYWANLLCGIGNAVMAAMPDSVVAEVEAERTRRNAAKKRLQRKVQKDIKDKLRG